LAGATRGKRSEEKGGPATTGEASALAERRRKDLLEAAYTLIAEKGLEGLRTRDIAARAGVNISTLHYYFETKEALLVAVVQHLPERFTAPREHARTRKAPWTLRSHLEEAWDSFHADPHLNTVLQELTVRAQRDSAARAAFRVVHRGWNAVVEGVLRQGIRDGRLRADLDPRAGAYAVTSFMMGAMLQLGVSSKAFDFAEVARQLEAWMSVPRSREPRPPRARPKARR
jgi:AcrR family transcriptional regulator